MHARYPGEKQYRCVIHVHVICFSLGQVEADLLNFGPFVIYTLYITEFVSFRTMFTD